MAQVENLWLRVQNGQPITAGVPVLGLPVAEACFFVNSVAFVDAQVMNNKVERVPMTHIKELLLTNVVRAVPIALARCDNKVVWGYVARRFSAQPCDYVAVHKCDQQIVLTTRAFLPAVINGGNVHSYDVTAMLKIDVEQYDMDRNLMARMLLCEFAGEKHECDVLATGYTFVDKVFYEGDLPPPPYDDFMLVQLKDALKHIELTDHHSIFCEETDDQWNTTLFDGLPGLADELHDGLPELHDSLPANDLYDPDGLDTFIAEEVTLSLDETLDQTVMFPEFPDMFRQEIQLPTYDFDALENPMALEKPVALEKPTLPPIILPTLVVATSLVCIEEDEPCVKKVCRGIY